jgi:hypothetical protein
MTVTFTSGSTSIVIKAPKLPEGEGYTYPMLLGRTMGGGMKTADLGDGSTAWRQNIPLNFARLSRTDYEALRDFIKDTVLWQSGAFSYTDPHSNTLTNMHYISGIPEARSMVGDKWNVPLVISKDQAA